MKDVLERFDYDTEDHQLQVIVDEGVNRILKFANKNGSRCYSVSVMQTRHNICFTGDMGSFVFANNNEDMLGFFMDNLSLSYISEKCRAGIKSEYSEDLAKEAIKCEVTDFCGDYIDDHIEHCTDIDIETLGREYISKKQSQWEVVLYNQALRSINFENEYTFYQSVSDLEVEATPSLNFTIDICDGLPCRDYTHRFKWCIAAMNKIAALYFDKKRIANDK